MNPAPKKTQSITKRSPDSNMSTTALVSNSESALKLHQLACFSLVLSFTFAILSFSFASPIAVSPGEPEFFLDDTYVASGSGAAMLPVHLSQSNVVAHLYCSFVSRLIFSFGSPVHRTIAEIEQIHVQKKVSFGSIRISLGGLMLHAVFQSLAHQKVNRESKNRVFDTVYKICVEK